MTASASVKSGLRFGTAMLALVLGLAACAGDDSTAAGDGSDSAAVQPLTLVAETTDGGQFEFGSLEGQDAVLWFWAPW